MSTDPYRAADAGVLANVLLVVDILAAEPTIEDDAVVVRLVGAGIGKVDAELLIRFVPCALSFGLLHELGVTKFPSTYLLMTNAGKWVELPLDAEPSFVVARKLGFDLVIHGFTERVSREAFQTVIARSAEMEAVDKALASGGGNALAGANIGPPAMIGLTAEQVACRRPGHGPHRPWWRFWQ